MNALFAQIIEKDPLQPNGPPQTTLVEIGPRFVLTPIRIFEGAFGGATVFSNPGELQLLALFIIGACTHLRIRRIRLTFSGPVRTQTSTGW